MELSAHAPECRKAGLDSPSPLPYQDEKKEATGLPASPEPAKVLKDETVQERLKDLPVELSAHAPECRKAGLDSPSPLPYQDEKKEATGLPALPEPAKVLKDETVQERLKDLHVELSAHAPECRKAGLDSPSPLPYQDEKKEATGLPASPEPAKVLKDETVQERFEDLYVKL